MSTTPIRWKTCRLCNLASHTCPGCGVDIEHGVTACDDCSPAYYPDCISCVYGEHYAITDGRCMCCGSEVIA